MSIFNIYPFSRIFAEVNQDNPGIKFEGNLAGIVSILADYHLDVYHGKPLHPYTLYGLPGGGKSTILKAAIGQLIEKCPELEGIGFLAMLNSSKLVLEFPDSSQAAGEISNNLGPYVYSLAGFNSIVLDETDAIAPIRRPNVDSRLIHATMSLLDNVPWHLAHLIITNYPFQLDPAVLGRAPTMIYLPPPDPAATRAIVGRWLNALVAQEVTDELFKNDMGRVITVRGLTAGFESLGANGLISDKDLVSIDAPTAARYVLGGGGGAFFTNGQVTAYRYYHQDIIQVSEAFVEMYDHRRGGNDGS